MRLAMLGGSFNPIHNGHLLFAEFIKKEFDLDKVLLMVASDPPHKSAEGMLSATARLEMTSMAASLCEGIESCDIELLRDGPSYTADTLRELRQLYPGAEIFCAVGADMLLDLPNWKRPEELLKSAKLIGAMRKDDREYDLLAACRMLREMYGASVALSRFEGPEISSTDIRNRIYGAKPVRGLIPENVERHIYENGHYMPEDIRAMQEKLRGMLKFKRYRHTMGTVMTAVLLADSYGADPQKTRLAALLHDCAKTGGSGRGYLTVPGVEADGWELKNPGLLHAKVGAVIAEREFGVHDPEVLQAIRSHTTGRPGMTKLEKIIYFADMIEPTRSYQGADELRGIALSGLDRAVMAGLKFSIDYVRQRGETLHPATEEAYKYMKKEIEKGG
jgi:nicotinate-nucleotide adenylyltransferase